MYIDASKYLYLVILDCMPSESFQSLKRNFWEAGKFLKWVGKNIRKAPKRLFISTPVDTVKNFVNGVRYWWYDIVASAKKDIVDVFTYDKGDNFFKRTILHAPKKWLKLGKALLLSTTNWVTSRFTITWRELVRSAWIWLMSWLLTLWSIPSWDQNIYDHFREEQKKIRLARKQEATWKSQDDVATIATASAAEQTAKVLKEERQEKTIPQNESGDTQSDTKVSLEEAANEALQKTQGKDAQWKLLNQNQKELDAKQVKLDENQENLDEEENKSSVAADLAAQANTGPEQSAQSDAKAEVKHAAKNNLLAPENRDKLKVVIESDAGKFEKASGVKVVTDSKATKVTSKNWIVTLPEGDVSDEELTKWLHHAFAEVESDNFTLTPKAAKSLKSTKYGNLVPA